MASTTHLTHNLQRNPSIFEIFAAELLDKLCYPAFRRIFNFLDDQFSLNLNIDDLLSSGLMGTLQYFYLRKYGSSFGESFYGLQRCSVGESSGDLFPKQKKILSVLFLILPHYFQAKYKDKLLTNESIISNKIPSILLVFNGIKVVQTLAYLMRVSDCHSPIFWLLKLRLKYPEEAIQDNGNVFWMFKAFELVAFFLQFLQWWHTNNQQRKLNSLRNPPPFKPKREFKKDVCPICLQEIKIPTANGITGLVYCWKCISNHLQRRKTCPVTNLATDFSDLIRIYET